MTRNTIPKKALVAIPDFQNPENGTFLVVTPEKAMVPAFDRSFHFGDSVYEVCRTYDGVPLAMEDHLRRLKQSSKLAYFESFPNIELIQKMVKQTTHAYFQAHGNHDVYIRVVVSRGFSDLNISTKVSSSPYALVFVKELEKPVPEQYASGVHYAVVQRRRNHPSALDPAMKSGNYLNNVLALAEAQKMGAVDAILLSQQGFVTEGTTNNVYGVTREGTVITAPLSVGILAGITREMVFEACRLEGIPIEEKLFTEAELKLCTEAFLSSSIKEIMPITTLTGVPVGNGKPGPITQKLHHTLKKLIHEHVQKHQSESLYL